MIQTHRFGNGPELLIAFHGFGDRGRLFAALEPFLGKHYTIVAPDLPFHGETQWTRKTFSKEDLLKLVHSILEQEGKTQFSLMGYSFGARLAMAMTPELLENLQTLYLLAPEGFKTKGTKTATRIPMWSRRLLHRVLEKPKLFLVPLRLGRKLGIVPKLTYGFLDANLSNQDRLMRTFGYWYALDAFLISARNIRDLWSNSNLPVEVYIGSRDVIVPLKPLQQLTKGIPNVRLHVLAGEGHRLVGATLAQRLADEKNKRK